MAASLVGSRGDSYDNALAETINGLYKAECDPPSRPLEIPRSRGTGLAGMVILVQSSTVNGALGYIPPAEAEANYYRQLASQDAIAA